LSEDNQDNSNNSFTTKKKVEVVKSEAEWNPVTDRVKSTETHNVVTIKKEYEVVRVDDSPMKMASRNDALADFKKNRVYLREVSNTTTDTTKQADTKEDTSDS
jgi:hypothetical protein